MNSTLRRLFLPEGDLSGRTYAAWGLGLFFCKYLLDVALMTAGFGESWWPTDYFLPRKATVIVEAPLKGIAMVAVAIPFVWMGVNLTLRRLKTLAWPASLVCLFFAPYINVLFFGALILKRNTRAPEKSVAPQLSWHAAVVTVAVTIATVAVVSWATLGLRGYGWGLFIGAPFLTGFVPALSVRREQSVTFNSCFQMMLSVQLLIAVCLLFASLEGIICILMAAPLSLALGAIGVFIGICVRRIPRIASGRPELGAAAFLVLPIVMLGEAQLQLAPSIFKVSSEIIVNAPPERVWKSVVTFSELPPPTEAIFHAGLAYPIRAEIQGHGVGAVRHCVFSTGAFVEPITTWNEPELLRFDVSSNPPPMKELSFRQIDPPHLHGFLVSKQGQFELIRRPDGTTRVIGTTWYQHGLWPEKYWKVWSDYIIHTIHLRVLRHIKVVAEEST